MAAGGNRRPLPRRVLLTLPLFDSRNSTLQQERISAFAVLTQSRGVGEKNPTVEQLGALAASWAPAHGFAMLYIDGRLKRL
jgi:hypothetical protein